MHSTDHPVVLNIPEKTFPEKNFSFPAGPNKKKEKLGQFSGSKPSGLSPQKGPF
jgi:hypothetical protein